MDGQDEGKLQGSSGRSTGMVFLDTSHCSSGVILKNKPTNPTELFSRPNEFIFIQINLLKIYPKSVKIQDKDFSAHKLREAKAPLTAVCRRWGTRAAWHGRTPPTQPHMGVFAPELRGGIRLSIGWVPAASQPWGSVGLWTPGPHCWRQRHLLKTGAFAESQTSCFPVGL